MKGNVIKGSSFRIGFVFLCLVLIASFLLSYEKEIKAISLDITQSIVNVGKKTVAVVDFTDLQGNVTELGRFLAEELSVALASSAKGFEVVERTQLKTIIQEHKLSSTGLIDPQTARKLGEIAGVETLVTGTITAFGESVRLVVKVLDTNTAKMIGASSADIPKTKAIEELLAKGIGGIAGSSTTPPQPDAAAPPTQAAKSTLKVEAEDYIFELVQCKLSGTTLTCYLIITNNAADRQLSIYAPNLGFGSHSRIIDQFGNEVSGRIAVLANNGRDYAELVSGIPIKGNIKFENVSTNMTSLALLELACSSYPRNFKVQFRNAPITK